MPEAPAFDPAWEERYGRGEHLNRWPWDIAVAFVFKNAPRNRERGSVSLLELGFGAGSNLWFAAREGFRVAGVEGSPSAVEVARRRFAEEGLVADLRVGDFTSLPFDDQEFDLVLDRGSVTCVGHSHAAAAVAEAHRVLRPGGRFLWNPYSDRHSSRDTGEQGEDGLTLRLSGGSLAGEQRLGFWSRDQVERVIASAWEILELNHLELVDLSDPTGSVHAEWRVLLEKP